MIIAFNQTEFSACTRKRPYPSKLWAEIRGLSFYGRLKRFGVYACPTCGDWHITTHVKTCKYKKTYVVTDKLAKQLSGSGQFIRRAS